MDITLVRPDMSHKDKAMAFRAEFFSNGETVINGGELLDRCDSYESWLSSVTANTCSETVDKNWVVTDTFFAVDENDDIVGVIDLRHTLNVFLRDLGNSGYSVAPSQRRKGIATAMLGLLLDKARDAGLEVLHLSVERSNTPSVKTIVRNGGEYERSFEYEGAPADVYRIVL